MKNWAKSHWLPKFPDSSGKAWFGGSLKQPSTNTVSQQSTSINFNHLHPLELGLQVLKYPGRERLKPIHRIHSLKRFLGFFLLSPFHQKGDRVPGQVRSRSLLSSSPERPGGFGPYLTGRGLHQTLCLAQSGCQESGTQEGHKHKRFLSPDNLFSQTKVSDSCLNPTIKARAEIAAMQKRVFLGPTRNSLSSPPSS